MAKQSVLAPDMGVDGPVEVIEVNVAVGDGIHVDDVIAIMESDKATLEVPASHSGIVDSLAIKVGDKVNQGDLLLIMSEENDAGSAGEIEASNPSSVLQEEIPPKHVAPKHKDSPQENTAQDQTKGVSVLRILVPDIGADNAEVIEVAQEGQLLNKDDAIVVLESDKASMEVPAPHAGIIRKLGVKVGDKLKQGDPLAEMDVEDVATGAPVPSTNQPSPEGKAQPSALIPDAAKKAVSNAVSNSQGGSVHAGPAVRRIAREFGITLSEVSGSGPKGRILKEDLMAYTTQKLAQAPQNTGGTFVDPLPEIDFGRYGETELIPRTKIQKVSAKNLLRSWHTVPQVTQFEEADITDLESFRKAQKKTAQAEGYKLTLLAFLIKAVTATLKKYPDFNASLENSGENLIRKNYFNIGIAVETPNGLVVPVVKDADKKGVKEIAIEIISLAEKARNKKLKPAEMQGATFTISSLGGLGGTKFTPIVNWPEVAILGVSRSELRPTYIDDELKPRLWLPLSLSYDHRVIDGAEGARFTHSLSDVLGDIRNLVL